MSGSSVASMLKSISSNAIKKEIQDSYEGVADAMKEIGGRSNNMLLNVIHTET